MAKSRRKATPPKPTKERRRNALKYFKLLLLCFAPLTLVLGIWVYWPHNDRVLVPGVAAHAICPEALEAELFAQIVDYETYRVGLHFDGRKWRNCTSLKIVMPPELKQIIQIENVTDMRDFEIGKGRHVFNKYKLEHNELGWPVIDVDIKAIDDEALDLEFEVDGMLQLAFEKFRLLIPKGISTGSSQSFGPLVPIKLISLAVPPGFEIIDVSPSAAERTIAIGSEMVYFGRIEFSEVNILLVSRAREWWKSIYAAFALAIATSILATMITDLSNSSEKHKRG